MSASSELLAARNNGEEIIIRDRDGAKFIRQYVAENVIATLQSEIDLGKSMYGRAMVVFAEERDKLQAELDAARRPLVAWFDEQEWHSATLTLPQLIASVMHCVEQADIMADAAGEDAERAIQRAKLAEGQLESATQPLAPEMERLNARVIALNADNLALRTRLESAKGALDGMIGLTELLCVSTHVSQEIKNILLMNHRVVTAREVSAAIDTAAPRGDTNG